MALLATSCAGLCVFSSRDMQEIAGEILLVDLVEMGFHNFLPECAVISLLLLFGGSYELNIIHCHLRGHVTLRPARLSRPVSCSFSSDFMKKTKKNSINKKKTKSTKNCILRNKDTSTCSHHYCFSLTLPNGAHLYSANRA